MTWRESNAMSERLRFVQRVEAGETKFAAVCREFGISRQTGYKWIRRYEEFGCEGLQERSRSPRRQPRRVTAAMEAKVLDLRDTRHWGARKIHAVLQRQGLAVPAVSTVQQILLRNVRIDPSAPPAEVQRFERAQPNELWQMDFKGHFPMEDGTRCHPLTMLDDHSRFSLALRACPDEQWSTVQREMIRVFATHGLPQEMLMDNGSPWRDPHDRSITRLAVWLMRLDVAITHGRPHHPQTQGKDERFHRSLKEELLRHERFAELADCQQGFDRYRQIYNWERPHEALGMALPGERYHDSPRQLPQRLPKPDYPPGTPVRKVQAGGLLSFGGKEYRVSKAFRGERVGIIPTDQVGQLGIFFGRHRIGTIDLKYLDR
jgi:transposase InsO family protein